MIYVRDGLTFSNENSTLADALASFLARRQSRKGNGTRPESGKHPGSEARRKASGR